MRRVLPLAACLVLALAATSALADDGSTRRSVRRADLLNDSRVGQTVDSRRVATGTAQLADTVQLPRLPVPQPGLPGDDTPRVLDLLGNRGPAVSASIHEYIRLKPQRSSAHRVNGIRLTDDPAFRVAVENGRRAPQALIIHGLSESGREVIITPR